METSTSSSSPSSSVRHSSSNYSLSSPIRGGSLDDGGRRGSLPKHLSHSTSETSLAERRRSQVSRYLESDDHKSEFASKLRDVRERERTVSGGGGGSGSSPLRNPTHGAGAGSGSGLKREMSGSKGGTTPETGDDIEPPPTDEALAKRERRPSALDILLASSLTLNLESSGDEAEAAVDALRNKEVQSPDVEKEEDGKPVEGEKVVAAEQRRKSLGDAPSAKPLPAPKELLARDARGRNMSMGGLEIIKEIKSPVISTPRSGDLGDEDPDSPLPEIAHTQTSNFPAFASPFGAAPARSSVSSGVAPASFAHQAALIHRASGASGGGNDDVSPGTSHAANFPVVDAAVQQLLSAPKDTLAAELTAKLSYFSALADENATLRQLIQRQADLSPAMSLRSRFKQAVGSPLAGGGENVSSTGLSSDSEDGGERDEVIRVLTDQLTEQMENHDKLIYELGLIRSHHATLQALSSDYVDELELLRHKVRALQNQVDGHQAEEGEAARRKEEEERARRENEERIATLRSALDESRTAIKRLQEETKERRRTLVESRRASLAGSGVVGAADARRLSAVSISNASTTTDGYTAAPGTSARRASTHAAEQRRASLRALQGDLGHRRRPSAALAVSNSRRSRAGEEGASSPEVNDSRRDSMVTAIGTPIGLGFEMGAPPSRRASMAPIALGGSGRDGLRNGETNWSSRPRRNSSGAVGVHIEGLSPKAPDQPVMLSEEEKEMRRRDVARGFRNAPLPPVPPPPATTSFGGPARSPRSPRKMGDVQAEGRGGGGEKEDVERMKAELADFEAMKMEMAQLKVKLAESEETRFATQDALIALKQFIASDAPGKQSPKIDSKFLTLPPGKEPTSPASQRKASRWAMPAMPRLASGFGLTTAAASSTAPAPSPSAASFSSIGSPAPSVKSLAPIDSPPPTSGSAMPSAASVLSGWTRRANSGNSITSAASVSPATSPSLDQQKTPSAPAASAFGKFSFASLVGKGAPPPMPSAAASSAASDASPPSLVASASSAESSPIGSPSLSSVGPASFAEDGKAADFVNVPIEIKEIDADEGKAATMDTPRVGTL